MVNVCRFSTEGFTSEQMRMVMRVQQGFHCSEVLLFAGLEARDKTNPDLIAAVSGLAGGLGFSGELCGALTGGACLLGLYAGRGSSDQQPDERLNIMISELTDWFTHTYGKEFGGVRCREITEDDPKVQPLRCPKIVGGVLSQVKNILRENGFEWNHTALQCTQQKETDSGRSVNDSTLTGSACPCAADTQAP